MDVGDSRGALVTCGDEWPRLCSMRLQRHRSRDLDQGVGLRRSLIWCCEPFSISLLRTKD